MKRIFGAIPVLLALLVTDALSDPVMECSAQFGSQVEVGDCLAGTEKNIDAAIETALWFAMASAKELDGVTERVEAVPALEAGQAAWVAYRALHCEFVGASFGSGSGRGVAIRGCRIELGRARTDELLKFAQ